MERTLDAIDQCALANDCLMTALVRPEIRPVLLNLYKSDLLDDWVGTAYYSMLNELPKMESVPPGCIVQLVMQLVLRMSKVRTNDEYQYICDVSMDLIDIYRTLADNKNEEIQGALGFVIGSRDHLHAIRASMFLQSLMNRVLADVPPSKAQTVVSAFNEAHLVTTVIDSLKDGTFFTDRIYDMKLKYVDGRMSLCESDDVKPKQNEPDNEWPDLISDKDN